MADNDKLRDMLDALIDDNSEKAQVDFHSYLSDKMKETLTGEEEPATEND
jgi:hypothetical protein